MYRNAEGIACKTGVKTFSLATNFGQGLFSHLSSFIAIRYYILRLLQKILSNFDVSQYIIKRDLSFFGYKG